MMAQFSPLTQRIVAVGIAILALLGAVNLALVPLYNLTAGSLSALEDARFERARLEAIAARPPLPRSTPVEASLYLAAGDRQQATDGLVAAIGAAASRYEVQLDSVAPVEAGANQPGAIALTLAMRGEHDKILALINELERGGPAVHFSSWMLVPDSGTSGPAVAPAPAEEGAPPAANPAPPIAPGAPLRLSFSATAVAIWERPS
jgi:type II secretion system (T2SS) protein M